MSASRFKFRAWHDYEGMTDDIVMGRKGFTAVWRGQGGLRIGQEFDAQPEPHKHFAILMQSTGLTDKNGVEIFEGDIVKDAGYGEGDPEFNDRYTIVFLSMINCLGFAAQRIGGGFCFEDILSAFYKIEVIGNIYANKELIK